MCLSVTFKTVQKVNYNKREIYLCTALTKGGKEQESNKGVKRDDKRERETNCGQK